MQVDQDGPNWLLRLDDGQDLVAALGDFARQKSIRAAAIASGIGMLKQATLGFWNGREYSPKELREPHELVALHGSIAEVDGAPSIHLHAGLADREHQMLGGHVLHGVVGVLAEIYITTFPDHRWERTMNESLGLRVLDLHPEPVG